MHCSHFKTQSLQHLKPNVFVSIKPLHVSVFFHDHLQGVLHCALCCYYSSHWFAFIEFVLLCSMWPHVYVICVCLVFLSVGDLLVDLNLCESSQADHQQTRTSNTHRWYRHATTYCVIIQSQWTQINGRNSNGTKHSGGPPEDGCEKRPKHVGVLYLQTRF
jgi:hypothetical protein